MKRLRGWFPRSRTLEVLEVSGLACIVAGVALIYVPAAVILAGVLAVAVAFALDRPSGDSRA